MNKAARFTGCFLAAVMLASAGTAFTGIYESSADISSVVYAAETSVKIQKSAGFGEGMYATWSSVSGASGYNVYVDGVQIDSMLIRQYSGYMRADAPGLKAGSHTMKVVPVIDGREDSSKAAEAKADVYAHDRSGFGFVNGSSSGAYNSDGTLKSDAVVVYVTDATKDKVTAKIDSGSGVTSVTGIQNIILGYKKGKEKRPLCIRVIGNITDPADMPKGDLMIDTVKAGVTVEGIGNDAVFNGFGLVMKNSSNVEVRNIGFMNCNSSEGDDCGLQQGNDHVWVHNCDFFYGDAGSDADQVKGDGALDTKTSTYVTHSYNHFWDNGKCNLQGMKDESTDNYITYHHNWYDHSDSRHPRIRTCSVHIYNNYFDGNAKYGVGVTLGASAFVDSNYFRACKNPMMSSGQGTDALGEGTFSGEAGGVIKAFNNVIKDAASYITYQKNSTSFDAYEVSSAKDAVPSSVKAVSGGSSYNNFDTSSVMYSYTPDKPEDVPAIVTAKAGRVDGGDLQWKFDNSVDDASYAVNKELKAALVNYKSSLVAVGSGFKEDNASAPSQTPATSEPAPSQTPVTSAPAPSQAPSSGSAAAYNFTTDTSSSVFTAAGSVQSDKGALTYNGLTLTKCLKFDSQGSLTFTTSGPATVTLVAKSKADGGVLKINGTEAVTGITTSGGVYTYSIPAAGTYTVTKGTNENYIYYIAVDGASSQTPATLTPAPSQVTSAPSPSQSPASSPSQQPAPSGNVSSSYKVVSGGGWNEMAYLVISGLKDADVNGVSYSGPASGSFSAEDLEYLVKDTTAGVRVDLLGLPAGQYSVTLSTSKGTLTKSGISVTAQDRSGYAHYNYEDGVGAYTDSGALKANAKIIYVTDQNKNTVTVTSKDGTKVTGIGNILNSVGMDNGTGTAANGGKSNTNQGIIKKLAEDGTPLVVRIVGNVTAPEGLTVFDDIGYGGTKGDNGFMARMKSGKDITIEGVGSDACMNGWGVHFMSESSAPEFGKSFEVRNIKFRNVPEDCIGMEGVQEGTKLTASVERCWIHNCEFYVPKVANPAESDKSEGDGACDFKRGQYFTNSYCYYEGYHKTNLVGASDSNLQFHLTYHNNYWKNCESRGPLARQANIHMYNNVFDGQTSYCMNPRADAYIFSEYNVFKDSKNPIEVRSGAVKSYNDVFDNVRGTQDGTIVDDRSTKVDTSNKYANFDTNSSVSYIPSGAYTIIEAPADRLYDELKAAFDRDGGCMKDTLEISADISTGGSSVPTSAPAPTTTPSDFMYGDIDNNGIVDLTDLSLLAVHLVDKTEFTEAQEKAGDVTGDGTTNLADLAHLKQYVSKLIDWLGKEN